MQNQNIVCSQPFSGMMIKTMSAHTDERGVVREFYRSSLFPTFQGKQINVTKTKRGVVRGMHGEDMTKLIGIIHGKVFSAFVDMRPGSSTRGKLYATVLKEGMQVLIPSGICNGFQSISSYPSLYLYSFDREWKPGMHGYFLNPLDPDLNIPWPFLPTFSEKDRQAPLLRTMLPYSKP